MPISVKNKTVSNEQTVETYREHYPAVRPDGLIGQIVTRFDFQNRKFKTEDDLFNAIIEAVADEATEIDLTGYKEKRALQAQFKRVTVGTVGPYEIVKLTAKEMTPSQLAGEAAMLETLRLAGLRTVPVYSTPDDIMSRGTMIERSIAGNFLDAKEGFSERQNVNLIAAFLGIPGINGETGDIKGVMKNVDMAMLGGQLPSLTAIQTLTDDFSEIRKYQLTTVIADLQGILEFRTGKFFIIDPLALVPRAEKKAVEDTVLKYVEDVISQLSRFKAHIEAQYKEKTERNMMLWAKQDRKPPDLKKR